MLTKYFFAHCFFPMQGINKLILILENTIGRLSSLSHDELCQKLKSVPFTSWFEQPGVKEKYKKPDLSEFEKGCSLTEAWEREPDNSQGKYYYRYITDSVRPCVSGAANFFFVLFSVVDPDQDPHGSAFIWRSWIRIRIGNASFVPSFF